MRRLTAATTVGLGASTAPARGAPIAQTAAFARPPYRLCLPLRPRRPMRCCARTPAHTRRTCATTEGLAASTAFARGAPTATIAALAHQLRRRLRHFLLECSARTRATSVLPDPKMRRIPRATTVALAASTTSARGAPTAPTAALAQRLRRACHLLRPRHRSQLQASGWSNSADGAVTRANPLPRTARAAR